MAQTVTRVIPDGDYPSRLQALYTAAIAAAEDEQKNPPTLLNGQKSPAEELAEEHEALKAEAEDDAREKRRVVTLRALGRSKWRELKQKHPIRVEGDGVDADTAKGDRMAGLNTETVEDDLVFASIIEPKFTSRADYDEWADELSEGEFQMLVRDAWALVNVAQVDPKSLPPSPTRSNGGN